MKRANGWIEIIAGVAGLVAFEAHAVVQSMIVDTETYLGGGNPIFFAEVSCPEGAFAVSGGADVTSAFFVTVAQSEPTFGGFRLFSQTDGVHGAPDGWSSAALMNPVQIGSTLKSAVLCSTSVTPQTVVASTSISPAGTGSATALCPDGGVALSGGVASGSPSSTSVLAFEPTFATGALGTLQEGAGPAPNGWTATVRNDGIFERAIKVAAICASAVTAVTDVTTFAVPELGVGERACPADGIATAGAFGAPSPAAFALVANAPTVLATAPDGANPAPTSWSSVVRNPGNTVIAPFAVVCVPEPSPQCAGLAALCAVVATRARAAPSPLAARARS